MDSVLVNPLRTCRDTGVTIVHTQDRSHIDAVTVLSVPLPGIRTYDLTRVPSLKGETIINVMLIIR